MEIIRIGEVEASPEMLAAVRRGALAIVQRAFSDQRAAGRGPVNSFAALEAQHLDPGGQAERE